MELNIVAIAYLLMIVLIFFLEFVRKKDTLVDFLSWFNVMFCLSYPIPAFLLEANFENRALALIYDNRTSYNTELQTSLAMLIGYLCVFVGFNSKSATKYGKFFVFNQNKDWKIILCAIGLLLFSSISILIYSSQYGGLVVALTKTNLIRAGAVEGGPLVFFKQFIFTSFVSSYLLASILFVRKYKKYRLFLWFMFVFSVVVSFVAATISSGRIPMINYFLGFYLVSIVYSGRLSLSITVPAMFGALLFILYGKIIFYSLSAFPKGFEAVGEAFIQASESGNNTGGLYEFMANFVYPVHSLDSAFEELYNPRFFVDWIYAFFSLIPSRILKSLFDITLPISIGDLNSQYVIKVAPRIVSVPPGLLAFGVYSMSWPGLIVFSFVYGWFGRYLQSILVRHIHNIYWMPFLYVLTLQIWSDFCPNGDPQQYLVNNFWFFLSSIILVVLIGNIHLSPKSK